jgi:hypothetical protein
MSYLLVTATGCGCATRTNTPTRAQRLTRPLRQPRGMPAFHFRGAPAIPLVSKWPAPTYGPRLATGPRARDPRETILGSHRATIFRVPQHQWLPPSLQLLLNQLGSLA